MNRGQLTIWQCHDTTNNDLSNNNDLSKSRPRLHRYAFPYCRQNILGNEFTCSISVSFGSVASAEARDHEIEIRDYCYVLAAVSQRLKNVNLALLIRVLSNPPEIAIFPAPNRFVRRGRAGDEVAAQDPSALPGPAVKHKLAKFHKVAEQQIGAAAAIRISRPIQRPCIMIDLHWTA